MTVYLRLFRIVLFFVVFVFWLKVDAETLVTESNRFGLGPIKEDIVLVKEKEQDLLLKKAEDIQPETFYDDKILLFLTGPKKNFFGVVNLGDEIISFKTNALN